MYRTDLWTLWEKVRVGCFERTAWKHVYYLGWNRSPAQAGCMRQVLGPGALGGPRGIGRRGRWEGGLGWEIHVNPWLIHVNVWQNPLKCCEVISLQLIKINGGKKKKKTGIWRLVYTLAHSVWSWRVTECRTELSREVGSIAPAHSSRSCRQWQVRWQTCDRSSLCGGHCISGKSPPLAAS